MSRGSRVSFSSSSEKGKFVLFFSAAMQLNKLHCKAKSTVEIHLHPITAPSQLKLSHKEPGEMQTRTANPQTEKGNRKNHTSN